MTTPKPCTLAARHAWTWQKNVKQTRGVLSARSHSVTISLRGVYACACGERLVGQPSSNGPDLRQLVDGAAR